MPESSSTRRKLSETLVRRRISALYCVPDLQCLVSKVSRGLDLLRPA